MTTNATGGKAKRRRPIQTVSEAEAALDAICSELMGMAYEGIMTVSRVAEILGWSVSDVRDADRYHHSWSVTEYGKHVGFTRQHIIAQIHDGKIPGAFKVPTQGGRFEFRIPKDRP